MYFFLTISSNIRWYLHPSEVIKAVQFLQEDTSICRPSQKSVKSLEELAGDRTVQQEK